MNLKRCPVCGAEPEIDYSRLFTYSAKVFCICGRETNWHDAIFLADAVEKAKYAWNHDQVLYKGKW